MDAMQVSAVISGIVSLFVSLFVARYELKKHEDIHAKESHLRDIKEKVIIPLREAFENHWSIQVDDSQKAIIIEPHIGTRCKIPLSFINDIQEYHFPELSTLWRYFETEKEYENIETKIMEIVEEIANQKIKEFPPQISHNFIKEKNESLSLCSALSRFIHSKLQKIANGDKNSVLEDAEKAIHPQKVGDILEVRFGAYIIYEEHVDNLSMKEREYCLPIIVAIMNIIQTLLEDEKINKIAKEAENLKKSLLKLREELVETLRKIERVQKLPEKRKKFIFFSEKCPYLRG